MIDEKEKIGEWMSCSERLPEEHDSIFAKFKGTDKWKDAMFERISENVLVTVEFDDGTRRTEVSHTVDGKWKFDISVLQRNIIAWQPLPEPYKEKIDG